MTAHFPLISSRTNPEVKRICELHESKGRAQHLEFIAEGPKTCATLIKNGMKVGMVYVTEPHIAFAQELLNDQQITLVTSKVMEKISTMHTPSGILGVFKIPAAASIKEVTSGLVLANVTDPGNVGALIRTAAALNIKTIIACDGVDLWNPKVVSASAGYIACVTIISMSWQALVTWKKELKLCALVVKGGKAPEQLDFDKTLLVVGNEAHGIPAPWLRDCQSYVTIPMPGKTESLNAAVAGSLALYLAFCKSVTLP